LKQKDFLNRITELIFNKKGSDVKILDLKNLAAFADYFIICSADSTTQVKAIADEIEDKLQEQGIRCWHREGYKALSWVLLDYVDFVIHVFKKDAREFYNLEKLWGDAEITIAEDPALQPLVKHSTPKPKGRPKKIKPE
jgi:ribosome-associated protein